MKYLLFGDPHAKPDNLEELTAIIDWAVGIAKDNGAALVFMGDQYDEHGVAKVAIMNYWRNTFERISREVPAVIALSGNHDMDYSCANSWMPAHSDQCFVVDDQDGYSVLLGSPSVVAVPYMKDNNKFVEIAEKAAADGYRYMLCHQDFEGSQLENGFYLPNGVKTEALPGSMVFLSGHIHKRQTLSKDGRMRVHYVGTTRHLTRSDIGEFKGITLFDPASDHFTFFTTPEEISPRFQQLTVTEGEPMPEVPASSRVYVDVRGSREFVKLVSAQLPQNVKARTFVTSSKKAGEVKESEGIKTAFMKYFVQYCNDKKLGNSDLRLLADRLYELVPELKAGL